MPGSEIELKVTWENTASFEVTVKEDAGPVLTVVKADENGNLAAMWPALTDAVERYIKALMSRIGKEMSEP